MKFRKAVTSDINEILSLVNQAYRGAKGWTNESSFVSGDRVEESEVLTYISNLESYLFVLEINNKIEATICVEKREKKAYISFFAVNPNLQAQGIGKQMITNVENFSMNKLNVSQFVIAVLQKRTELIEFYYRRGYIMTDKVIAYPQELNVGKPMIKNLKVIYLEKKYTK